MRTTVLDRLECRRIVPFDPNDHSLLDRGGTLDIKILDRKDGMLKLAFRFEIQVKAKVGGALWGVVEGSATIIVESPSVGSDILTPGSKTPIPEQVTRLVEGAFADDLLLPISQVVRSMHLPGLLLSPVDFAKILSSGGSQGIRSVQERREKAPPPPRSKVRIRTSGRQSDRTKRIEAIPS